MCNLHWQADHGLVTLGAAASRLRDRLDAAFVAIARQLDAEPMRLPPLLPVAAVDSLDYFRNFPQLPLAVSGTNAAVLQDRRAATADPWDRLPTDCLAEAGHILPPAACYAVYIHHRDQSVGPLRTVTTVANCFRNESYYDGLRRLKGFTMREIVFLGDRDPVLEGLARSRNLIQGVCDRLGIAVRLEQASDPFFDPNSARALTQKLFPTKQELLFGDLAIASANFHRNFFGERFAITSGGQTAFTACIGMGLERWLHALLEVHDGDIVQAQRQVDALPGATAA